jgi:hypothetical protein
MNMSRVLTIIAGLFLLLGAAFAFNETDSNYTNQTVISPAPQENQLNNLWNWWSNTWTTQPLLQLVPALMVVFVLLVIFLLRNILPIKLLVLLLIIAAIVAFALGWVKL